MDSIYMVKVPVAFMMHSTDEHKMTNVFCVLDEMNQGSDEFIYFGEPEIQQVF